MVIRNIAACCDAKCPVRGVILMLMRTGNQSVSVEERDPMRTSGSFGAPVSCVPSISRDAGLRNADHQPTIHPHRQVIGVVLRMGEAALIDCTGDRTRGDWS